MATEAEIQLLHSTIRSPMPPQWRFQSFLYGQKVEGMPAGISLRHLQATQAENSCQSALSVISDPSPARSRILLLDSSRTAKFSVIFSPVYCRLRLLLL